MNDHAGINVELGPDALDALAEYEAAELRLQHLLHDDQMTAEKLATVRADLSKWAQIFTLRTKSCAALAGRA